jgi:hypothetical protein
LVSAYADLLSEKMHRGEAFDKLYLRSVLAEVFHPVGLEGDAAFRAAARVRLLIARAQDGDGAADEPTVAWDDPDIAWLTGLHEAEGHRYFNKEAHEQMLWWMQLPRLVELTETDPAGKSAATRKTVSEMEAAAETAAKAAKVAGYKLDALLKTGKPDEKTRLSVAAGAAELTTEEPAPVEADEESVPD